jgi:hypothetical protein
VVGNNLAHLEIDNMRIYPHKLRRDSLIGHLDRRANYFHVKKTEKKGIEYFPDRPPKDVADDLLSTASPPLPRLQAVVNTPVIAPDGRCVTTSGYHPEVELYLDLAGLKVPSVPESPLPSDVARARVLLLDELLIDFPFAGDADLAHAISPLITTMARPLIDGPTPLHLFDAPMPGTGKGLLTEVVTVITTGGPAPIMSEAKGREEWAKQITAALVEAPSIILIDNIQAKLDASPLAAALTSRIWAQRELGTNTRRMRLPVRCTWIATGNNASMSMEIARRTVRSRIDSAMEYPWERAAFRHDPLIEWVQANRGELCWAVLTLIRAWIVMGRPEPKNRLGSFEGWSRVVGGILKVAEIPGFLGNRAELYTQAESDGEAWRVFVTVWWEEYAENRVGVSELFDLAKRHELLTDLRGGSADHGARVAMGMNLAAMRDRRIGDYWLRDTGQKHGGGASYRLEKVYAAREGDSEKDSPDYTNYTEGHAWSGEYGETGETFSGSAPGEINVLDSEEVTLSAGCKRPLAMEDIAALDDALDPLCSICADGGNDEPL